MGRGLGGLGGGRPQRRAGRQGGRAAIGGLIIVVVIGFLLSAACSAVVAASRRAQRPGRPGGGRPGGTLDPQSDTDQFLAYVVADIQDFWAETFSRVAARTTRTGPRPVRRRHPVGVRSASSATGPFCPGRPEGLPRPRLLRRAGVALRRPGRRLRDGLCRRPRVRSPRPDRHRGVARRSSSRLSRTRRGSNDLSVRQELQADCLAGVWAHSAASGPRSPATSRRR